MMTGANPRLPATNNGHRPIPYMPQCSCGTCLKIVRMRQNVGNAYNCGSASGSTNVRSSGGLWSSCTDAALEHLQTRHDEPSNPKSVSFCLRTQAANESLS